MTVEVAPFINGFNSSLPNGATDPITEGDNHLRLIKSAVLATFPNITNAVTPTHLELNYVAGVTSAIQTQFAAQTAALAAKANLASPTFTGTVLLPATGTGTLEAATKGYVDSVGLSSALPGQAGNAGKFVTTNGTTASWADAFTGTAKATVDLLTGTAIASAATINLDTATGNRVHVTGTTTITTVTLTRGPRTVIFDGILTLTHNATTNNLPSAANIVTAAGDRAIYESDGTTVYCVDYVRASGQALVNASVGGHEVTVHTGNGCGSTNTRIRRFTTALVNTGTAITYADSATLGATFTINENGLYEIYYSDSCVTASPRRIGVTLNSSQLSTDVDGITNLSIRLMMTYLEAINVPRVVTRTVRLVATDVIRAHTQQGDVDGTNTLTHFSIRKIAS